MSEPVRSDDYLEGANAGGAKFTSVFTPDYVSRIAHSNNKEQVHGFATAVIGRAVGLTIALLGTRITIQILDDSLVETRKIHRDPAMWHNRDPNKFVEADPIPLEALGKPKVSKTKTKTKTKPKPVKRNYVGAGVAIALLPSWVSTANGLWAGNAELMDAGAVGAAGIALWLAHRAYKCYTKGEKF